MRTFVEFAGVMAAALLLATSGPLALAAPPPAPAEPNPQRAERRCVPAKTAERFHVDLREAPLQDLARLVSCAAGMNLVFTPSSLGSKTVTVMAPKPISLSELVRLFRHTLLDNGLAMERRGSFHAIVPIGKGGSAPPSRPRR